MITSTQEIYQNEAGDYVNTKTSYLVLWIPFVGTAKFAIWQATKEVNRTKFFQLSSR